MQRMLKALAFIAAAASIGAHADTISLDAPGAWTAIAPPGAVSNNCYPCSLPINSVGLAWEAANTGWNSSASYNASAWGAYSGGWINNSGITPFYARDVFDINGTATAASFTMWADDDSIVWVNGIEVPGLYDADGNTDAPRTANISSYLVSGENVIAFKANNSAGGGFGVSFSGSVNFTPAPTNDVPEPASLALVGLGLVAILSLGRRQAKRV